MADFSHHSSSQTGVAFPTAPAEAAGGATPQCFRLKTTGGMHLSPHEQQHQDDDVHGVQDAGPGGAPADDEGAHPMQQQQEQHGSPDFVTSTLRQVLATDIESFFQNEVAPCSAAIAEDMLSLQYEADQLSSKAAADKVAVLLELDRLHKLVASFQAQIMSVFH